MKEARIFELAKMYSEKNPTEAFHSYRIDDELDQDTEHYRVDCGDEGSFEIKKKVGEEFYDEVTDEWVSVLDMVNYYYFNTPSLDEGFSPIQSKRALEILTNQENNGG